MGILDQIIASLATTQSSCSDITQAVVDAAKPEPLLAPEAMELIVKFETGGRAYYDRFCARPSWPGESSGVTIGFGWDCGYNDRGDLDREWSVLSDAVRGRLAGVMGVRGAEAKGLVPPLRDIVITWDTAQAVFQAHTLPRFLGLTLESFPGADRLPPLCLGALVSLVINRGAGISGSRRIEMAAIHGMVERGDLAGVPTQIRAMKRLWPNSAGPDGLQGRREAEVRLWERGLAAAAK